MSTDRLTVQMVVAFIGFFSLLTIGGVIALAYTGRAIPDPLSALGGAAVGALSSLLARTATVERREDISDAGNSAGGPARNQTRSQTPGTFPMPGAGTTPEGD